MSYRAQRVLRNSGIAAAFLVAALGSRSAQAQRFRPVEDGQIHEAFVPAVTGISALEAIDKEPPPPITEKPPPTCDAQAIWIKGYWAYDEDSDDFEWVGGCWRRPPTGHYWIDGFWERFDQGFVWIRGFWSPVPARNLVFIEDAPPDPLDDDAPTAGGSNYFWLAGYWGHQPQRGYVHYTGRWIEMDPNFILVPASYTWRPEGYFFIPAYWDWPLERRGCTYQTVYIEPAARVAEFVYEPVVVVEPAIVVGWCYSYYPNYVYFVHHHYHHHHDWWYAHYDVPTWWGWHGWWALSWHDHWGVWWWWSHPGYPHPHFMSATYAARIAPPVQKNVFKVKNVYAPRIVTVNGVVTPKETLKNAAKDKSKGTVTPVVAARTRERQRDDDKDPKASGDKKLNKDDKGDKDDRRVANAGTLRPTGTKSAKDDDDDDPKNKPPKPTKKQPNLVNAPGGTSGAAGKGKDEDKTRGKGNSPPITTKGRTSEGDTSSKRASDNRPDKSDRSDRSDKSERSDKSDKPAGKSGPPIVPSGSMKDKERDKDNKDKDKDKAKPKGRADRSEDSLVPPVPTAGDRPKDKGSDGGRARQKDRSDDSGVSKKPGGGGAGTGGGGAPGPNETKARERDKPPPAPGGDDRGDKPEKDKKKDKNRRN